MRNMAKGKKLPGIDADEKLNENLTSGRFSELEAKIQSQHEQLQQVAAKQATLLEVVRSLQNQLRGRPSITRSNV